MLARIFSILDNPLSLNIAYLVSSLFFLSLFIILTRKANPKLGVVNWIWAISFLFVPVFALDAILDTKVSSLSVGIGICLFAQLALTGIGIYRMYLLYKKGVYNRLILWNDSRHIKSYLLGIAWLIPMIAKFIFVLMLSTESNRVPLKSIVIIGFFSPLLEEFVFRHVFPQLIHMSKVKKYILISVVFSLPHLNQGIVATIMIFLLSLYYFIVYEKTGSFLLPVTLHSMNNITSLFW